MDGEYIGIIR